jgi:hypothetical protein
MKKLVPEEVIKKTVKCPNGFACLSNGHHRCEVCGVGGEDALFINNRHVNCPYRILYGESQICACPTHYYLSQSPAK